MSSQFPSAGDNSFIQQLPNEILAQIFDYLLSEFPSKATRACNFWLTLRAVCRRWQPIIEELACTKAVLLFDYHPDGMSLFYRRQPWTSKYVRSINYVYSSFRPGATELDLNFLGTLKAVRSLTLDPRCNCIWDEAFETFRKLPLVELKILNLHCTNRSQAFFLTEFSGIPTLRNLTIEFWAGERITGYEVYERPLRRRTLRNRLLESEMDLDRVLPESKQRTSSITNVCLKAPNITVDLMKRFFLWPARLESVSLTLLDRDIPSDRRLYKGDDISDMLLPHASSLKSIELDSVELDVEEAESAAIPDLSTFECLETLSLFIGDVIHEYPEVAVQKLITPTLKRLVLNVLRKPGNRRVVGGFTDFERGWMMAFVKELQQVCDPSRLTIVVVDFTIPDPEDRAILDDLVEVNAECEIQIEYENRHR